MWPFFIFFTAHRFGDTADFVQVLYANGSPRNVADQNARAWGGDGDGNLTPGLAISDGPTGNPRAIITFLTIKAVGRDDSRKRERDLRGGGGKRLKLCIDVGNVPIRDVDEMRAGQLWKVSRLGASHDGANLFPQQSSYRSAKAVTRKETAYKYFTVPTFRTKRIKSYSPSD